MPEMGDNSRRLVVEGIDDLYSVVGVMRAHISWPADQVKAPVWIDRFGSVDEILKPDHINMLMKSSNIQMLGIMVDANSNCSSRYKSIYDRFSEFFPNTPRKLPRDGMVVENDDRRRFGVWIMPDNVSDGALEDFLIPLIPDAGQALLKHVDASVETARNVGASYRDAHANKARLYSWLALQDPPTQNPRQALYSKALDPRLPTAMPFVTWFKKLYRL